MDINDILGEIKPVERTVEVCTAGDLVAAMEQDERLLQAAMKADAKDRSINPVNTTREIAERMEAREADMAAKTRTFRFRAMSKSAWRTLVSEHPPTDRDRDEGFDYDADTLPIAAVAVCCVDPAMSVDQAAQLADKLGPAQWTKVWMTARECNTGVDTLPKSVTATAVLLASEPNSTTASPEGSLTPSSSAE